MRRSSRGNPRHYPAGSPKGGQFAPKNYSGQVTRSEKTDDEYKQQTKEREVFDRIYEEDVKSWQLANDDRPLSGNRYEEWHESHERQNELIEEAESRGIDVEKLGAKIERKRKARARALDKFIEAQNEIMEAKAIGNTKRHNQSVQKAMDAHEELDRLGVDADWVGKKGETVEKKFCQNELEQVEKCGALYVATVFRHGEKERDEHIRRAKNVASEEQVTLAKSNGNNLGYKWRSVLLEAYWAGEKQDTKRLGELLDEAKSLGLDEELVKKHFYDDLD